MKGQENMPKEEMIRLISRRRKMFEEYLRYVRETRVKPIKAKK